MLRPQHEPVISPLHLGPYGESPGDQRSDFEGGVGTVGIGGVWESVGTLISQYMGMGLVLLCARAEVVEGMVPGNSREIKFLLSWTPKFILGTSYIALETSENVIAMGTSRERPQNVSESEGESIRFPAEERMAHS